MIQCKTIVNEEIIRVLVKNYCNKSKFIQKSKKMMDAIGGISLILGIYWVFSQFIGHDVNSQDRIIHAIIVLALAMFLFWYGRSGLEKVIYFRTLKQRFDGKAIPLQEVDFTFEEEGITIEMLEGKSFLRWQAIEDWIEDGRYILYKIQGSYCAIDKQGFENKDMDSFEQLVERMVVINK